MSEVVEWFRNASAWFTDQFNSTFIVENRYMMFVKGTLNTLFIALCAAILGVLIGIVVSVIKVQHEQTGKAKFLNTLCNIYLAIFRGTPIIVQIMIMYYIIFANVDNGIFVAILSFGINSGAYVAEIIRAGIMAVDIGQTEAGRSLGLSRIQTMIIIVLPQAIKNILPALGNEFITLLKETSVVAYISINDLTKAGNDVRINTLEPYFSLFFVAIVYFCLVFGFTRILQLFERRLRKSDRS